MADTPETAIKLTVSGQQVESLESLPPLPGWESELYALASSRAGGTAHEVAIPEDGWVEFELAGGERILVAADNIGAYLGSASRAGDDGGFRLGESLHPAGRPGADSRGLRDWVVKALRIAWPAGKKPAARLLAGTLAGALETKMLCGYAPGFYQVGATPAQLVTVDAAPKSTEPLLVLIHGTISSADGSFGDLWAGPHRRLLEQRFPDRVYALQHNTLTESPVANALALARALPPDARLHLLTHSRGGLVGELLARGNRKGIPPFTDEELRSLTESAEVSGREGYKQIVEQLRSLRAELERKRFRIERFVRVACPARGTTLLAGRLDRWASALVNMASSAAFLAGPIGKAGAGAFQALHSFAAAVVAERSNASTLPGLEAMTPDSPLVALLNSDEAEIEGSLHVVAGDYEGNSILKYLGDAFAERYYGGETDLVVNTASMHGGARRDNGIFRQFFGGPEGHHHLNYFAKPQPSRAIALALTDPRPDIVPGFERVSQPSRETIARGGKDIIAKANAPILFILPGILGSAIQRDGDTVWFNLFRVAAGGIGKLAINEPNIGPAGWLDMVYEKLAWAMAASHEVRPFAYDWRLSIATEAERFGKALDLAIEEGKKRNKPVRILAHSMGGLIARLALRSRWGAFKSLEGARFVQLGTPNGGSVSIAGVLLARDSFVNKLAALDLRHGTKSFLEVINKYPGFLELMAWKNVEGETADLFAPELWAKWHVAEGGSGDGDDSRDSSPWPLPDAQALSRAKEVTRMIAAAPIDPDVTVYVAGWARRTPVAVTLDGDRVGLKNVSEGDGRVAWATGIPDGVKAYYTDAAHGDLPSEKKCFPAYKELLERGETTLLSLSPPARRGLSDAEPEEVAEPFSLYPNAEELIAAAMGGTVKPPEHPSSAEPQSVEVVIVHGSLATSQDPVIIGAYAYDGIRGTAEYVDGRLGGRLARSHARGTYPNSVGEAQVFLQTSPDALPRGAIAVGLGPVGSTTPGDIARAYQHGLLAYANALDNQPATAKAASLDVATLLIGTGFGGLSVETSLRALLDAIIAAARKTTDGTSPPLHRVTVYERADNRAITTALALRRLMREPKYAGKIHGTALTHKGKGGYRALVLDDAGSNGMRRVHIALDKRTDSLHFTLITDRARNPVEVEPSVRRDIDGLLRRSTADVTDRPGIARAMFELLVPNDFKEGISDTNTLILGVDYNTAEYPWELLRDAPQEVAPLSTRIAVVRQLATERGRRSAAVSRGNTAFIVGDTDSGYAPLPGARDEANIVSGLLRQAGWDAPPLLRPGPDEVFEKLFDTEYRIFHLACHGIAEAPATDEDTNCSRKPKPRVGAVLSQDVMLTPAHVNKLRRVPEFVFLNCCHLGDTSLENANRWNRLAANLAVQFIEMGARAVVAAGWEVHDGAANVFARTIYEALLRNETFGQALKRARAEVYLQYPHTNTWGAYQAYGDENYRLQPKSSEGDLDLASVTAHRAVLLARLEELRASAEVEIDREHRERIGNSLDGLARSLGALQRLDARIRSAFGYAYAALQMWAPTIDHFRAALSVENAEIDVRAIERLADAETRHGAELISQGNDGEEQGLALMDSALERLDALIAVQPSVERYCLQAANFKRRAEIVVVDDRTIFLEQIQEMVDRYGMAVELGSETGRVSYYPDTNHLFGLLVLREHGRLSSDEIHAIEAELDSRVARIVEDASRRASEEDDFFHLVAEADGRLAAQLWTMNRRPAHEGDNDPTADIGALTSVYARAVQRFGSAREINSTYRQFQSLTKMLPGTSMAQKTFLANLEKSIKTALRLEAILTPQAQDLSFTASPDSIGPTDANDHPRPHAARDPGTRDRTRGESAAPDAFESSLAFVLRWEGGYVDHPNDPGGKTNKGVTQAVYDAWRTASRLPKRSVRDIEHAEVEAIYRANYWAAAKCDLLSSPLDLVQFDTAVNMGVGRAVRFLQTSVGTTVDGGFGPGTQKAVDAADPAKVVVAYCNERERYYRALCEKNSKLAVFLKGWLNRLNSLRTQIGSPAGGLSRSLSRGAPVETTRIPDIGENPEYDI